MATVALVVAVLDQVTKWQVVGRLVEGEVRPVLGMARLRRITNRGGGLIPLSPAGASILWFVALAAAVVALSGPGRGLTLSAGLGLLLGGASSNLADRVARGGVVDFVALGRWPAFNLADAALVAGAASVLVALLGL